jgi:hypothetical protein
MAKQPQSRIQGRSSVDGKFVKPEYVKSHPNTTQNERLPLPGFGDTGRGKGSKGGKKS